MKSKSQNSLFDPESNTRKNVEFILTLCLGCLGIFYAYTANELARKYGNQQDQIDELKTITQTLRNQDTNQQLLIKEAFKQTGSISEQLIVARKNHYNDSIQFAISILQPNILQTRKLLAAIQLNQSSEFRIKDGILSYDVIPHLKELAANVDEILDNPIFLMHMEDRSKCVDKMPHASVLLESLDFYATTSQNYFGEKQNNQYYFKDESTIEFLNTQFEGLKKQQLDFVSVASKYYNQWYKIKPK